MNLERWRYALERRGMKMEYMSMNERERDGMVRLQGVEVVQVNEFIYLGSTVYTEYIRGMVQLGQFDTN